MTDMFTANHTELVITCGCTPLFSGLWQHKETTAPWTGPYRVLKRLTDSTYRIQSLSNPRKCAVVHFDRLRSCPTCSNSTYVGLLFLTDSVLHQLMTVSLRLHRKQHPSVHNWRSLSQWILLFVSDNFHPPSYWHQLHLVVSTQPQQTAIRSFWQAHPNLRQIAEYWNCIFIKTNTI